MIRLKLSQDVYVIERGVRGIIMKITRIELRGYNQFKDTDIDLTYPQGHEKAGKPLDKICIIGQSGSGKTSLLRLLKWFVSLNRDIDRIQLPLPPENAVKMEIQLFDLHYRLNNIEEFPHLRFEWDSGIEELDFFQLLSDHFKKINPMLINFPTEIIAGDNRHDADKLDTLDVLEKIKAVQTSPYKLVGPDERGNYVARIKFPAMLRLLFEIRMKKC